MNQSRCVGCQKEVEGFFCGCGGLTLDGLASMGKYTFPRLLVEWEHGTLYEARLDAGLADPSPEGSHRLRLFPDCVWLVVYKEAFRSRHEGTQSDFSLAGLFHPNMPRLLETGSREGRGYSVFSGHEGWVPLPMALDTITGEQLDALYLRLGQLAHLLALKGLTRTPLDPSQILVDPEVPDAQHASWLPVVPLGEVRGPKELQDRHQRLQLSFAVTFSGEKELALLLDPIDSCLPIQKTLERAGYQAHIVKNHQEVLQICQRHEIGLLLSELDLGEDVDGVAFAQQVRTLNPDATVIFYTHIDDAENIEPGMEVADDFLIKPIAQGLLAAKIIKVHDRKRRKVSHRGISGSLEELQLPELMQVLSQGRRSGQLTIHAQETGTIDLDQGKVLNAICGNLKGEQAFYEMLGWEKGEFSLDPEATHGERLIHQPLNDLLLHGLRILDKNRGGIDPFLEFEDDPLDYDEFYDHLPDNEPISPTTRPLGDDRERTLLKTMCEAGILSRAQADDTIRYVQRSGNDLPDALCLLGYVRETTILQFLASEQKTRYVTTERLSKAKIPQETLDFLPAHIADQCCLIPVLYDAEHSTLSVVIATPIEEADLREVHMLTRVRELRIYVALRRSVQASIDKHYRGDVNAFDNLLRFIENARYNAPSAFGYDDEEEVPSFSYDGAGEAFSFSYGDEGYSDEYDEEIRRLHVGPFSAPAPQVEADLWVSTGVPQHQEQESDTQTVTPTEPAPQAPQEAREKPSTPEKAVVEEPTPVVEVEESAPVDAQQAEPGDEPREASEPEAQAQETRVLRRKASVRYFSQMNPQKVFPLLVSILQAELQLRLPEIKHVEQVESKQVLEIQKASPFVTIVPILPGCQVVPAQAIVDVRADKVDTTFWVTPLVTGDFRNNAVIQIWAEGELKDEIPIPVRLTKQTLAKASALCSAGNSLLKVYKGVAQVSGAKATLGTTKAAASGELSVKVAAFFDIVIEFVASVGFVLAFLFLLAAIALYFLLRPRKADPIEQFLSSEIKA